MNASLRVLNFAWDSFAVRGSGAPILLVSILGCGPSTPAPLPPPTSGPLANVVVLPLTTRSPEGLLGHAMEDSGLRPDPSRQVVSTTIATTTRQHVVMLRAVAAEVGVAGQVSAGLRLSVGGHTVSHLRYDVWIDGYLETAEQAPYLPESDCCVDGDVDPTCKAGYVSRLLRGTGSIEYLIEVGVEARGGFGPTAAVEHNSRFQRLDQTHFEDTFFAFETRSLEAVCADVGAGDMFEATAITPPPNCKARAFYSDGEASSMKPVWLPDDETCTLVVDSFCAQKPSIRCEGSYTPAASEE